MYVFSLDIGPWTISLQLGPSFVVISLLVLFVRGLWTQFNREKELEVNYKRQREMIHK